MPMIVCNRGRGSGRKKSAPPPPVVPVVGREYIVSKYWTGTFRGRVVAFSEMGTLLRIDVTDAIRPGPLIEDKCPYPECISEDGHEGDHRFSTLRNGAQIELRWSHATFTPVELVAAVA
jgi:hypothetical protein